MEEILSLPNVNSQIPNIDGPLGKIPTNRKPQKISLLEKNQGSEKSGDAIEISKTIENVLNSSSKEVKFAVTPEKKSGYNINFKVINKRTGEVVREFPSGDIQRIARKAKANMHQGLLVDSSA